MGRARQRKPGWGFLLLLGLPSLGLALAATTVSTYLPVLLKDISGPAVTGILIGAEGLLALFIPPVVGRRSDTLQTRIGGRMPFLLVGAPLSAAALLFLPLAGSIVAVVPILLAFYVGYFLFYPPYRAEYPDLVPASIRGRSQSAQKTLREAGLILALVGGGLLLSIGSEIPFALAAAALLATTAAFFLAVPAASAQRGDGEPEDQGTIAGVREVLRRGPLSALMGANLLWELALGAIKTFVILFFIAGLGRSSSFASAVLSVAAVAIIGGALLGGRLGDRVGELRVLHVAVWVYGLGLLVPLITQSPFALVAVPFVAFAGGIVMTLSFAALMRLMPEGHHGTVTGVFGLSRGAGALLGPVLAGLAIELCRGPLASTDGYAAMWGVASIAVLLSLPLLSRARSVS
ncbi:MAG TPA: MFS transporter [Solirubrobacterales bacterium]|jgi:Na+/melibiose symporter-like transporter